MRIPVLLFFACASLVNIFHYGNLSATIIPCDSDHLLPLAPPMPVTPPTPPISAMPSASPVTPVPSISPVTSIPSASPVASVTSTAVKHKQSSPTEKFSLGILMSQLITELMVLDEELKHITTNETAMEAIREGGNPSLPFIGKKLSNFYIINDHVDDKSEDVIAMVSHISTNKLDRLFIAMRWWNGPISIAVLVTSLDEINELVKFWKKLQSIDGKRPSYKIVFHIYLEARPILASGLRKEVWYPHNILRNQAFDYFQLQNNDNNGMQKKKAQFFVAMDIDVLTSPNCYAELQQLVKDNSPSKNAKTPANTTNTLRYELMHNKRVMVLPVFGQNEPKTKKTQSELEAMLPVTRGDVRKQYEVTHEIDCFHCAEFRKGQSATDFPRWMAWNESRYSGTADAIRKDPTRSDLWFPIEFSGRFEPYIMGYVPPMPLGNLPPVKRGVASNFTLPKYFEFYRGLGWNKVSWIQELDRAGYKFGTLLTAWSVHLYHPGPKAIAVKQHQYNSNNVTALFRKHMDATYGMKKRKQTKRGSKTKK